MQSKARSVRLSLDNRDAHDHEHKAQKHNRLSGLPEGIDRTTPQATSNKNIGSRITSKATAKNAAAMTARQFVVAFPFPSAGLLRYLRARICGLCQTAQAFICSF